MISAEDFLKENPVRLVQAEDSADSSTESRDSRPDRFQADSVGAPDSAGSVGVAGMGTVPDSATDSRSASGFPHTVNSLPTADVRPVASQKDDSCKEDISPVQAAALGLEHGARFGGSLEDIDSAANTDMSDESLAGHHPSQGHRSSRGFDRKARRRGRHPRAGGFGGGSAPAVPRADADDADVCREAALTLLDAAARSSGALARRLADKGFDMNVINQVIDRLTRLGLVDDQAYAQDLLRSCLHRTLGERGVLSEMTRKGLDSGLAAQVVAQASREGLFVDSAYELGRKVARKTAGLDLKVRKRRFWSAGSRKGHSPDLLNQVAADLFASDDPLD